MSFPTVGMFCPRNPFDRPRLLVEQAIEQPAPLLPLRWWTHQLRDERLPLIKHMDEAQDILIGLIRLCIMPVDALPILIDLDTPSIKGEGAFGDNKVIIIAVERRFNKRSGSLASNKLEVLSWLTF